MHIPPEAPNLQPPGAGIGTAATLLARYIWMPGLALRHSEDDSLQNFLGEAKRISSLVESFDAEALATRVLVRPQLGLEDSSRWWSIALTVEHLIIVNAEIAEIVVALSHGAQPNLEKVTTERVKPKAGFEPTRTGVELEAMVERFTRRVAQRAQPMHRKARWRHPWFGPMNAHRWLCLAGAHQGLHRRQMEAIATALRARPGALRAPAAGS